MDDTDLTQDRPDEEMPPPAESAEAAPAAEEPEVALQFGEFEAAAEAEDSEGLSPFDEFEAALAGPKDLTRGELVEAMVVDIGPQAIIVDLGTKFEGFIPREEFAGDDDLPAVGDTVRVSVVNVDEENERIRVSKRRADYERVWGELSEAREKNATVTAMVTERVRGGLRVDVGVPGFVPASQVEVRDVRHLDRFVGRTSPCA